MEACAKLLGGVTYQYSLKGDDSSNRHSVAINGVTQRAALQQLLAALSPDQLAISANLQSLLGMPPAFGYAPDLGDEMDSRMSAANFDVVASYETAANIVVSALFESHRVERLAAQGFAEVDSSNESLPSLSEVMEETTKAFFPFEVREKYNALELMSIQSVLVNRYLSMAYSSSSSCERFSSVASAQAMAHLTNMLDGYLNPDLGSLVKQRALWLAHINYLRSKIEDKKPFMKLPSTPQGGPI